jgi:hypothetical protein
MCVNYPNCAPYNGQKRPIAGPHGVPNRSRIVGIRRKQGRRGPRSGHGRRLTGQTAHRTPRHGVFRGRDGLGVLRQTPCRVSSALSSSSIFVVAITQAANAPLMVLYLLMHALFWSVTTLFVRYTTFGVYTSRRYCREVILANRKSFLIAGWQMIWP